ncbi:hypothetical protein [Paenibacillus wenxiniae]|uniref:Uncharacterized protein n=1 Tax=Paenibacillus wenxiniae TaxID=1636843 RepID=A0ABW4RH74_9BACL
MRLKGTMTEQTYRNELQRSYDSLFKTESGKMMRICIEQAVGHFITAYILHWIPEQGADFFTLLVDGQTIVHMEIEYAPSSSREEKASPQLVDYTSYKIHDYTKGLSKTDQIKFEVALDMCHRDMNP